MAKKEKKENKLKKSKVETQENANEQATVETVDDFAAQIEQELEKQEQESKYIEKVIVQDGKTFIDITENYVSKSEEVVEEVNVETQVVHQKKKVRTFNEIFSSFFKGFIPLKKDSTKEKIRKLVMDVAIIAIIVCGFSYGKLYYERRVELQIEEELKGQIFNENEMSADEISQAWKDVLAMHPNIDFGDIDLKYSYLYAVNQDLVGWIKIENTNLDVQVVQAEDNDFYLRRNFYKESSRYGCPYMDYRNNGRYLDTNTVIYGHHMTDGLMFSNLDEYKSLEGYKKSPIIQFDTLYDTYYFKVFAAFITNAHPEEDNGYVFNFTINNFGTDRRYNQFIKEVQKRSLINTGVTVNSDDKIITLVTCTYDFREARLVVMGRLVRPGEDLTVDTSGASLNTSPKYPQAWYDENGVDNPYNSDEKWE